MGEGSLFQPVLDYYFIIRKEKDNMPISPMIPTIPERKKFSNCHFAL